MGKPDEAELQLQNAIEIDPTMAKLHFNIGHAQIDSGKVDKAIESLRRAVEFNPNSSEYHVNLGNALAVKRQWDEAIACAKRGIELDPLNPLAHNNVGASLVEKGQYVEAVPYYRKATELAPKTVNFHLNLGNVSHALGRIDQSIASFRKVVELEPEVLGPHLVLGAMLCDEKKDYDGAIIILQKAVAIDSKSVEAHTYLGVALSLNGRMDKAFASVGKAIALDPKNVHARINFAMMLVSATKTNDDVTVQTQLRTQALEALREILNLLDKQLESGGRTPVQQSLRVLQMDADLIDIRDAASLARLPVDQQNAFAELWSDVKELLKKADSVIANPVASPAQPTQIFSVEDIISDQSVRVLEQAFANQQAKHSSNHPETLASMKALARAYLDAHKSELSISLNEKILKLYEAKNGPDHVDTLSSVNKLAVACRRGGQLDKSIPLFERVLKANEAKHGRDHSETLRSMGELAITYADAGRLKEAIRMLEEVQPAAAQYPRLHTYSKDLLLAYLRAEQFQKAESSFPQYLPEIRKRMTEQSLASWLAQSVVFFLQHQKWTEAEPLLRECLTIREKLQPDHWTTFNTQSALGGALLGQKKYAKAEPLLQAGYEGMKKRQDQIPPQDKARQMEAVERLVQLYEALEKTDELAKVQKELKEIQQEKERSEKLP